MDVDGKLPQKKNPSQLKGVYDREKDTEQETFVGRLVVAVVRLRGILGKRILMPIAIDPPLEHIRASSLISDGKTLGADSGAAGMSGALTHTHIHTPTQTSAHTSEGKVTYCHCVAYTVYS